MKITAFYPVCYTDQLEASLQFFTEKMGFKVLHDVKNDLVSLYVLECNGYRLDVLSTGVKELQTENGFYGTRINVEDFEDALDFFKAHGYKVITPEALVFENTKLAMLEDLNGARVFLYNHIK